MTATAVVIARPDLLAENVVAAWLAGGHRIARIVTTADEIRRVRWRDHAWAAASGVAPLPLIAKRHGIPVVAPPRSAGGKTPLPAALAEGADTLITAMTRIIVPADFLARFGARAVNFHPALLPHYKGPSPRLGMLADGVADRFGGVTLHVLAPAIDAGPIIARRAVPLAATSSFWRWEAEQAHAAAGMTRGELQAYLAGSLDAAPQMEAGSYRHVRPGEFRISSARPLAEVERLIALVRGFVVWCDIGGNAGGRTRFAVTRVLRRVGPAAGTPPVVASRTIEMDVADARIVLGRRRAPERLREWFAHAVAVRRAGGSAGWA